EVTQKSGEINKGQLLAYAEGSLTLKMDDGKVVTQDGASVVSVKFIAKEKLPTAAETELTIQELVKFREIRATERKNAGLTKEEQLDFKRLRAKTELHIKALEREIQKSVTEEDAHNKLIDLARSYILFGTQLPDLRGMLKIAADSIENENTRQRAQP